MPAHNKHDPYRPRKFVFHFRYMDVCTCAPACVYAVVFLCDIHHDERNFLFVLKLGRKQPRVMGAPWIPSTTSRESATSTTA